MEVKIPGCRQQCLLVSEEVLLELTFGIGDTWFGHLAHVKVTPAGLPSHMILRVEAKSMKRWRHVGQSAIAVLLVVNHVKITFDKHEPLVDKCVRPEPILVLVNEHVDV